MLCLLLLLTHRFLFFLECVSAFENLSHVIGIMDIYLFLVGYYQLLFSRFFSVRAEYPYENTRLVIRNSKHNTKKIYSKRIKENALQLQTYNEAYVETRRIATPSEL